MVALGQRKDIDFDNSRWVLASLYNLSIIHRGALGDHPCGLFLLGRSYIELISLVISTWTEGGFCINLSSHANTPPFLLLLRGFPGTPPPSIDGHTHQRTDGGALDILKIHVDKNKDIFSRLNGQLFHAFSIEQVGRGGFLATYRCWSL